MPGERDAFCVLRDAFCVSHSGYITGIRAMRPQARDTRRRTHHARRITLSSHAYAREERPVAMRGAVVENQALKAKSPNHSFRQLEVRILDQPDRRSERVGDGGDADPVADVLR